jgi:hypothetical protein
MGGSTTLDDHSSRTKTRLPYARNRVGVVGPKREKPQHRAGTYRPPSGVLNQTDTLLAIAPRPYHDRRTVEGPAFALVELSLCSPSGSSRDRVGQTFTPVPNQDLFVMVSRKRKSESALTAKRRNSCLFAIPTPIGCSLWHVANMAPHLESRRLVSIPVSFPLHSERLLAPFAFRMCGKDKGFRG